MLKSIQDFKGLHPEKRVFIMCSGPSLAELDLKPLERRLTIGLNRSFMAFHPATYHCVMDLRLYELYKDELSKSRYLFTFPERPFGIPITLLGADGFSWDLAQGIYSGYTVSYYALQLAVYMGFEEIYFLGLDLKNKPKQTHFFGHDYHSEDHETTEFPKMRKGFESIAPTLKERGIKVYNCSEESSLECFPYMSYAKAISL